MTDDIVARLRSASTQRKWWPRDRLDAADEIERLKNQISHIIEHNNPQIENANSYFKLLEDELARCNKIIDDYEEEHIRLREALREVISVSDRKTDIYDRAKAVLAGEKTE